MLDNFVYYGKKIHVKETNISELYFILSIGLYFQKLDWREKGQTVIPDQGVIINQALLSWDVEAQDILNKENLRILNAGISFENFESVPEEIEFSSSIKTSLKKIDIKILEDQLENYHPSLKRLANLIDNSLKGFQVLLKISAEGSYEYQSKIR